MSTEPQVQDFLKKVSKIVLLFLKDFNAPKELHRSALKFTKVAITYLDWKSKSTSDEMLQAILNHVFTVRDARKYTTTIRRIVTKLIIRVGVDKVKAGTPVTH